MLKATASTLLLALQLIVVQAQNREKKLLDLPMLLVYGMQNNLNLKQSVRQQQLAEMGTAQLKTRLKPQINGGLQFNYYPNLPVSLLPGSSLGVPNTEYLATALNTPFQLSANVELNQQVVNKELRSSLKVAAERKKLTLLATRKQQEEIAAQISGLYYGLFVLKKQIALLEKNEQSLDQLVSISSQAVRTGLSTKTDYDQLLLNRHKLQAARESLTSGFSQQMLVLRQFAQLPDSLGILIPTDWPTDTILNQVLNQSQTTTDVLINQQETKILFAEWERIKAGASPLIMATAQVGNLNYGRYLGQTFNGNYSYGFQQVGLRLSLPIYDGNARHLQKEQNLIEQEMKRKDAEIIQNNTQVQRQIALEKLRLADKLLQLQRSNLLLAQNILTKQMEALQNGLSPIRELIQADTALREQESEYFQALNTYFIGLVEYQKASGILLSNLITQ